MRLTARGWAVAGAGAALAILWYLFGEAELGVATLLAVTALTFSVFSLAGKEPRLSVARRTSPAGVHESEHASVRLSLVNRGRRISQFSVSDEVESLGTAEFATATFPSGREFHAVYRVLCRPRGIYSIGPARVILRDPLGLAAREGHVGSNDTLVVYPAVETLHGLPGSFGQNLAIDAHRPRHGQQGGEDFYTLREYQQGDDMRRIHWPSSARRDRLMTRQLETPWQARSLILLDVRPDAYPDNDAFEAAVSGAASVVRHLSHHTFEAELWSGGPTIEVGDRSGGYARAMENLARVAPREGVDLSAVASRLRNKGGGGMLVVVTGRPDTELSGLFTVLSSQFPTAVVLAARGENQLLSFQRLGVTTVAPEPGRPWAPAWDTAMRSTWHSASVGS